MKEVTVGNLGIGRLPRLVGAITTSAGLARLAGSTTRPPCDLVEVRLGEVETEDARWVSECRAIENRGIPVLITLREQSEGGTWPDEDPCRLPLFETALEEFSLVDVELNSRCLDRVIECAKTHNKPVIISTHDFQQTPTREDLDGFQERVQSLDNIILKIAVMTHDEQDVATLQDFLLAPHPCPVSILGMGEKGMETRIRFPGLGSCLTYGYLDASSAPGQHSCEELMSALRQHVPGYNEDLRLRGRGGNA